MSGKDILLLISRYRNELMGYAILGVLAFHFFSYANIPNPLVDICQLIYTPGFFFLSGFGIYFSLKRSSDLWHYYIKRIKRVFIPYLLIGFPFFTIYIIVNRDSLLDLLSYLSTLYFWVHGNKFGIWFIAIILLLYTISPLFFFSFFEKKKNVLLRGLFLIAIYSLCLYSISFISPSY